MRQTRQAWNKQSNMQNVMFIFLINYLNGTKYKNHQTSPYQQLFISLNALVHILLTSQIVPSFRKLIGPTHIGQYLLV